MPETPPINVAIPNSQPAGIVRLASSGLDIARQKITGYALYHQAGYNSDVDAAAEPVVSAGVLNFPALSAAEVIAIAAGGAAADAAAGTGAREVTAVGLDAAGDLATITLVPNGASKSTASATALARIFDAWVSKAGSGEVNAGLLSLVLDTAGTELCRIDTGAGRSRYAFISIPANHAGYLHRLSFQVQNGDNCDFRVVQRIGIGGSTPARGYLYSVDGVTGNVEIDFGEHPLRIEELSDLWVEAIGSAINQVASAELVITVVDETNDR